MLLELMSTTLRRLHYVSHVPAHARGMLESTHDYTVEARFIDTVPIYDMFYTCRSPSSQQTTRPVQCVYPP